MDYVDFDIIGSNEPLEMYGDVFDMGYVDFDIIDSNEPLEMYGDVFDRL